MRTQEGRIGLGGPLTADPSSSRRVIHHASKPAALPGRPRDGQPACWSLDLSPCWDVQEACAQSTPWQGCHHSEPRSERTAVLARLATPVLMRAQLRSA